MGGTFNPIHIAHTSMARAALIQADLDKVLFMPSKNPPHKSEREVLAENFRADMVKIAIKEEDGFVYSDFELKREGTTYSADTLRLLNEQFPEDTFFFIMGGDSFFSIEKWYRPEEIMKRAVLLPISRDDAGLDEMLLQKKNLEEHYGAKIQIVTMPAIHISSSDIREKLSRQEDVSRYLSKGVTEYIKTNHLYV